jgi:hypothetical protein
MGLGQTGGYRPMKYFFKARKWVVLTPKKVLLTHHSTSLLFAPFL